MKVQTEEAIVNQLAEQINRLETLVGEARAIISRKAKTQAASLTGTSPVIYRRVRLMTEQGAPDNLNCITFAFRINYAAEVLQAGWSIANNENVDLDRGRALAAKRLDEDPLEVEYRPGRSLVNNVYAHFFGARPSTDLLTGSFRFNNNLFNALKRKLRGMQSQKSSADQQALEREINAFVDALDNR